MILLDTIKVKVAEASQYDKSKSDDHAEVFTPDYLVADMVKRISIDTLSDPAKTYFDPCAGKGNFPIVLVRALMKTLAKAIPNEDERLKHIIEEQLFMSEYQEVSANLIAYYFQMERGLKVNLHRGDSLDIPADFFDLTYEERRRKYPFKCVIDAVEPSLFDESLEVEEVEEVVKSTEVVVTAKGADKEAKRIIKEAEKEAKRIIRDAEKRLNKAVKAEERLEAKLKVQSEKKANKPPKKTSKKVPGFTDMSQSFVEAL